jgi:hypothetical protein
MNGKFSITLALAAGFIGGVASHYLMPTPVHAQAETPALQEIRAHKFVLVDEHGVARGVFGFQNDGSPNIELMTGNDVWGYSVHPGLIKHGMLPEIPQNKPVSK